MRRVVNIQPGVHPDTPEQVDIATIPSDELRFSIYADGEPLFSFLGWDDACQAQRKILDAGKVEYCDLRVEQERRIFTRRTAVEKRHPDGARGYDPVAGAPRGGWFVPSDRRSA